MAVLIESPNVTITNKIKALKISIDFSKCMNRYAAMDTCKQLVLNITDENLAQQIINMMRNNPTYFINDISAAHCKSPLIRDYLETIKVSQANPPIIF